MKKRYFIIVFLLLLVPSYVKALQYCDNNHPCFTVVNNGIDKSGDTITLSNGVTSNIGEFYHYKESKIGTDAFCLDSNLSSATSKGVPFEPALEDSHTKNLYDYLLSAGADDAKEFAQKMILYGQNYMDNASSDYRAMSYLLRMQWFNAGWNIEYGTSHYNGADKELYKFFRNNHTYDFRGERFDNLKKEAYGNGQKMNPGDGFTYDNGFWEARAEKTDTDQHPGFKNAESDGYEYDAVWKTNIRADGSWGIHEQRVCNTSTENLKVEYDSEKFDCTLSQEYDELISNKTVYYIHLKSKAKLDNANASFKVTYIDSREAKNFWITYAEGTNDSLKSFKQRMYVIAKEPGEIILENSIPPKEPTPEESTCTPIIKDNSCSIDDCSGNKCLNSDFNKDGDKTTFSIGDDINCVFNQDKVNKTVSDGDETTYTQNKNEYCSLTCAETIDFDLPGSNSVIAGKYWTWQDKDITIKGTRKCQATVAINAYKNDLGIGTSASGPVKERLSKIFKDGKKVNNPTEYGLIHELDDLKAAYDEYSNPSSSTSEVESHQHSSGCPGDNCSTWTEYCYEDKFESAHTNQTFYKYHGDCDNSNHKNESWEDKSNSISLTKSKENIKELFNNIVTRVETKTEQVNTCTHGGKSGSGLENIEKNYDFEPRISMKYTDKTYGNIGISYLPVVQNSLAENSSIQSDQKFDYYKTITSGSKQSINYNPAPDNSITWTKTIKYNSNRFFYMKYIDFSKGTMSYTSQSGYASLNENQNYKFGNNVYPVSLTAKSDDENIYTLMIDRLGVSQSTGKMNSKGRFDSFIKDSKGNSKGAKDNRNRLDYTCQYEVTQDVCVENDGNNCKPNFFFRNVSLNNFDPNNRTLGKNWNNEKGKATICEIDGKKYDQASGKCSSSSNNPEGVYEADPEYSFELTPDDMQYIKSKNREAEKNGNGYANWDMTAINTSDGSKYQKIWFTSNFIDDLEKHKDSIVKSTAGRDNFSLWNSVDKKSGTGPAWK